MDVKGPRTSRADKARATRRRIVDASAALFVEQGYGATTLDQVAARSGVAVQTVYFHFRNKATLLKEALDVAAVGDDEPVALLDRPWLETIQAEPDPRRVVELWVANGRSVLERIGPVMAVVRGAVGTDPDLAARWAVTQEQTRAAHRTLAELLDARGALRPGLGVDDAADLAYYVNNIATWFVATGTLGWTPEQWERTTASQLEAALLDR